MATTTEPPIDDQDAPGAREPDEQASARRTLRALFVILAVAAIALLALLLWLLRPKTSSEPSGPAGYPIQVITTIYGYGQQPNELLAKPLGVAFDQDGNVWISDTNHARVEEYTSGGDYIRTVGDQKGTGKLYGPFGLTVDPARGYVYVADLSANAVQIYNTADGGYVGQLPSPKQKDKVFGRDGFTPYDVQISPDGRIVVSSNDGLYWFDQDGNVVARWGATIAGKNFRGPGEGMFNFPDSFTIDPQNGDVYVADTGNRRVVALDSHGIERWVSGVPDQQGKIKSFWQLPRSIELGPDGNLYVIDTFRYDAKGMGTGFFVVLSKNGSLLSEFGRAGNDDGAFAYPDQLASGPDGLWAIADRENNRVVIFRLLTPYPKATDLLARRYPETFSRPDFAWVTPPPTPPELQASASASP
jgi:DNA-binding beta-propeller fold protein YncE